MTAVGSSREFGPVLAGDFAALRVCGDCCGCECMGDSHSLPGALWGHRGSRVQRGALKLACLRFCAAVARTLFADQFRNRVAVKFPVRFLEGVQFGASHRCRHRVITLFMAESELNRLVVTAPHLQMRQSSARVTYPWPHLRCVIPRCRYHPRMPSTCH